MSWGPAKHISINWIAPDRCLRSVWPLYLVDFYAVITRVSSWSQFHMCSEIQNKYKRRSFYFSSAGATCRWLNSVKDSNTRTNFMHNHHAKHAQKLISSRVNCILTHSKKADTLIFLSAALCLSYHKNPHSFIWYNKWLSFLTIWGPYLVKKCAFKFAYCSFF